MTGLNRTQNGLRRLWGAKKFEEVYMFLASKNKNKKMVSGLLDAVIISQLMTAKKRARLTNTWLDADPVRRREAIRIIDGLREC